MPEPFSMTTLGVSMAQKPVSLHLPLPNSTEYGSPGSSLWAIVFSILFFNKKINTPYFL